MFENQPAEYTLGQEIAYLDKKALVVRIDDYCALFDLNASRITVDELFVELLTEEGETAFITLRKELKKEEIPDGCKLRGPEPLTNIFDEASK